ncbi:mino acid [Diaporthe amygdali]|uniref:mino acid n=1 Tax=Phomopsis amygdali TaxID=1214568 RepID=UPI0022FE8547|nr:mino acid [Diaporthe amygdali]KAJ0117821.1 mino acid [Diaporthe amygdali]
MGENTPQHTSTQETVPSSSATASNDDDANTEAQPLIDSYPTAPAAKKHLTVLNGLALVIALQIGSGIFTLPSQVSQYVPSPGTGLLVWLLAGLLVWTGASSFIELGCRVPSNGGIQEYVRVAYGGGRGYDADEDDEERGSNEDEGDSTRGGILGATRSAGTTTPVKSHDQVGPKGELAGFLFTWTWVVLAKPAANGAISTIATNYLTRPFLPGPSPSSPSADSLSPLASRLTALACMAFVTIVNCLGATSGAKAANVFLMLKLSALGSIILMGLFSMVTGWRADGVPASETGWFGQSEEDRDTPSWQLVGNFVTATFGAVFCYGGWETVGFVLGDMAHPERDLPRVITGAMITVMAGFALMNAAIYICLPFEVIRTSSTVAVEFARRTLGSAAAGVVFSIVVSASALGALNANTFATARLCVAAAHRGYFPAVLANLHCRSEADEADCLEEALVRLKRPGFSFLTTGVIWFAEATRELRWRKGVPVYAMLLNGLLAAFFIVAGSFNGLVVLIGLAEYTCFLAAVLGLLLMRSRERYEASRCHNGLSRNSDSASSNRFRRSRPSRYRTWIGNPVVFSSVSAFLILRAVVTDPFQGLAILLVAGSGVGAFSMRFGWPWAN